MSEAAAEPARNAGVDALRAATTLLVVLHHTAITYGGQGGWFYQEVRPTGALPSQLLTMFCAINQAWFMGLFFLLAGLYTLAALRRKGAWRFIADRALRLGLPWLVFVLVLGPMSVALGQTARGQDLADTWRWLLAHHAFVPGPLWSAQALFGFSLPAVAWQALARRAYAVFVIHPPVLVAVALAWAAVPAPVLLKFAVTGAVSCVLCHLVAGVLLRLPGVARVL